MTLSGTLSIPAGVSQHSFTELDWPVSPTRIIGTIIMPGGGDLIHAHIIKDSITTDGFDIALSGETPDANYEFNYIAVF